MLTDFMQLSKGGMVERRRNQCSNLIVTLGDIHNIKKKVKNTISLVLKKLTKLYLNNNNNNKNPNQTTTKQIWKTNPTRNNPNTWHSLS